MSAGAVGKEAVWIRRGFVEITTDDPEYQKLRTVVTTNPNPNPGWKRAPIVEPAAGGLSIAIRTTTGAGTAEQKIQTDASGHAVSSTTVATSAAAAAAVGSVPGTAPSPVTIDVKAPEQGRPGDPPGMVTIQVPIGSVTSVVATAPPPAPAPVPQEPPKPPTVHILGRGEFFTGLQAFTGVRTNKFTATAKSVVQLLILNWVEFQSIIKDFADVRQDMEALIKERGTLAFG